MSINSFREALAKPVINLTAKEFGASAAHLLSHYNKSASAEIARGLSKKEGNTLRFPLPTGGLVAGRGYNLRRNGVAKKRFGEITTFGAMNVGLEFSAHEKTYEGVCERVKTELVPQVSDAFAREAVDNYLGELQYATGFVAFNPGNPGDSLLAVETLMRRTGMSQMKKPNLVGSTGLWQAMERVKRNNTTNDSIQAGERAFNILSDVNSIPTYKTGDRAGLCLKVYTPCQSGCTLYISGGADAAGRMIIRKGEVVEICGVKAVDKRSYLSQGYMRQFQAKCDVWADSKGVAAVSIEPELIPVKEDYTIRNQFGQKASAGGVKNVDTYPKDGADVYVSRGLAPNSEYEQTLIYYDDMMVRVTAEIDEDCDRMQMTMPIKSTIAGNLGKMQFEKGGSIQDKSSVYRWDMNLDNINLFPELGIRMVGNKVSDC